MADASSGAITWAVNFHAGDIRGKLQDLRYARAYHGFQWIWKREGSIEFRHWNALIKPASSFSYFRSSTIVNNRTNLFRIIFMKENKIIKINSKQNIEKYIYMYTFGRGLKKILDELKERKSRIKLVFCSFLITGFKSCRPSTWPRAITRIT